MLLSSVTDVFVRMSLVVVNFKIISDADFFSPVHNFNKDGFSAKRCLSNTKAISQTSVLHFFNFIQVYE